MAESEELRAGSFELIRLERVSRQGVGSRLMWQYRRWHLRQNDPLGIPHGQDEIPTVIDTDARKTIDAITFLAERKLSQRVLDLDPFSLAREIMGRGWEFKPTLTDDGCYIDIRKQMADKYWESINLRADSMRAALLFALVAAIKHDELLASMGGVMREA